MCSSQQRCLKSITRMKHRRVVCWVVRLVCLLYRRSNAAPRCNNSVMAPNAPGNGPTNERYSLSCLFISTLCRCFSSPHHLRAVPFGSCRYIRDGRSKSPAEVLAAPSHQQLRVSHGAQYTGGPQLQRPVPVSSLPVGPVRLQIRRARSYGREGLPGPQEA